MVADLDRLGLIGQTVDGRYTIIEQIGEGGMGTVYRAQHVRLGRQVAIKFLHQAFAKDHEALDRFFNEARAAATLGHPNIAESFDVGELAGGSPFIVLELLHGRSIHDEVSRAGRLSIRRALRIARQIALGLDAAHQRGIIHRDLKSENVLLTDRAESPDHVKILDFGVARILENSASITKPGHLIGTPEVMPPEQILSPNTVDARIDIYAAGVILYQMLSGQKPFDSLPLPALLHRILEESPPPLTFLPDDVRRLVEDAMARDRERRIQTATELRDRIDGCITALASPATPLRTRIPTDVVAVADLEIADTTAPSLRASPVPTPVEGRAVPGRYRSLVIRALGAAGTFAVAGALFAIFHFTGHSSGHPTGHSTGSQALAPSAPVAVAMNPVDVPVAPTPPPAPAPAAREGDVAPVVVAPAPPPASEPTPEPIEVDPAPAPSIAGPLHPTPTHPHASTSRPHTARRGAAQAAASTPELSAPVAPAAPSDGAEEAPPHAADAIRPPAPDAHAPVVAAPGPGAGPVTAAAAAPPVTSAAPPAPVVKAVKKDEIDVAATRAAVHTHVAAIQQCYERAKMDDLSLAGSMTVRITMAPDGAVTAAEVIRSTIRSPAVEGCVTAEMLALAAAPADRWQPGFLPVSVRVRVAAGCDAQRCSPSLLLSSPRPPLPSPSHPPGPARAVRARSGPGSAAGSDAAEPVLEPEHVSTGKPPPLVDRPAGGEPITVDQLVIAASSRLDFNFFGDVSLQKLRGQDPGFAIGPLGFQVTAHLADGLVGRTEYALSFDDPRTTVIDVERAFLEYRRGHWMLAAGRTHAEFGYWNNAFHHGRWLQLTINRPRVLRFEDEGGMLQVHQVGVTAVYGPERGDHGLEVAVGVGNGHGPSIVDVQTLGDNNLAKSVVIRVGEVGLDHDALRFGVNLGIDQIAAEPATVRPLSPGVRIFELLSGAYVALRSDTWIAFSEVYNVLHRAMGRTWQITDGFAIVGYRLGPYIPYAQLEARRGDGLFDPFYNPDPMASPEAAIPGNYVEGILGMHYDLSTWSALKLELSARRFQSLDDGFVANHNDYRVELNWSFGR